MNDATTLRRLLEQSKTIAVVGMSDKVHRASYTVGKYLMDHGYRVIPVNPTIGHVLGQKSYATLADIPVQVDMIDCFRRPEQMVQLAQEAVAISAACLWMQLGIENEQARALAEQAGIAVIMNRCTKIEHARLFPD